MRIVRSAGMVVLSLCLAGALAGCGADEPETSSSGSESGADAPVADNVIDITIADGEITPAPGVVSVPLNEDVTVRVTSDVDDEVHIHGYDEELELQEGETTWVTFMADIPGVFEVETHESEDVLAELKVE